MHIKEQSVLPVGTPVKRLPPAKSNKAVSIWTLRKLEEDMAELGVDTIPLDAKRVSELRKKLDEHRAKLAEELERRNQS